MYYVQRDNPSINCNVVALLLQNNMDFGNHLKDFSLPSNYSAIKAVSLSEHLVLRNACIEYRDNGGSQWVQNRLPEASAAQSTDQIPCLNRFDNIVGHMNFNETICFPIQRCNSYTVLCISLIDSLREAIETGRLWAVPGTVKYHFTGEEPIPWRQGPNAATPEELSILLKLRGSYPPLSANTTHAAMEANHFTDTSDYSGIFLYPHNAAISVGLLGSLHDNQCIDMSPGEEKKKPNSDMRSYKSEFLGYVCAGHTSHSTEAGRVRRLACSTHVRLLTSETLVILAELHKYMSEHSKPQVNFSMWTVFCMGFYCEINDDEMKALCTFHRKHSLEGPTKFSLHINVSEKFVNISISSGTVVKRTSSGYHADNIETHVSDRFRTSIRPRIDTKGKDQHRACFSAFFNLVPYISSDRAPRPLISSVQTPQAACLVWCPGNAAVQPCYTFNPMLTTPMYREIMNDLEDDTATVSCHLAGENVVCMYLNKMGNYEDAILVSQRYIDNGGFSTYSMCSYNLPQSEYIPPVGSVLCGKLSKWWKSPCQKGCTHDKDLLSSESSFVVGYKPTGVVYRITHLNSGDINVRVKSYQPLQPGDKLSMGHGQKGIAVPTPYEDMPRAYSAKHGIIVPDIVMAMSSVVTRQTNGVLYEAAKSLTCLHENAPLPQVIQPCETADVDDEFIAISGITGEPYRTILFDDNGNPRWENTLVTVGFNRVMNQTQMSRERHQISHVSAGRWSTRTTDGRARGGGVAKGEMEGQAMSSAGLQYCDDELSSRGDRVVTTCCTQCQRLGLLCTCTTEENSVPIAIPYDLIVFDSISAIVYNGSLQFQTAPEYR